MNQMTLKRFILLTLSAVILNIVPSIAEETAPTTSAPARKERKLYVGKDSTEAIMTYTHFVELESDTKPTQAEAKVHIENQVMHLFGPMGEAKYPAVPKGDHVIEVEKIEKSEGSADVYVIHYTYRGTIVVKNGPENNYEIIMPRNPNTIYSQGSSNGHNPCTDDHYQSEGDFWYFWSPSRPGCKLKDGEHFDTVKAAIKRSKNTAQSFPEYNRLADNDGVISIMVLMGMDNPNKGKDPNESSDINASNFRDIKKDLLKSGFENKKLTSSEIEKIAGKKFSSVYIEEFTKETKRGDQKFTIVIHVFFGPSGIDEASTPFHYLLKAALEDYSIMIYDGHSGLGGHLDLASIENNEGFRITPNKKRYQIYFFNSCSSYPYYNTMFFDRKKTSTDAKGTKNLDIFTNGLATYFHVMQSTNMALIQAVDAWATGKGAVSYQTIAKKIDSGNLFGINGDEDNPKTPESVERARR